MSSWHWRKWTTERHDPGRIRSPVCRASLILHSISSYYSTLEREIYHSLQASPCVRQATQTCSYCNRNSPLSWPSKWWTWTTSCWTPLGSQDCRVFRFDMRTLGSCLEGQCSRICKQGNNILGECIFQSCGFFTTVTRKWESLYINEPQIWSYD